ncbi:MAG: hypothetical protein JWR40_4559 [Massilia sp.]|nr:hypothetical protein [Massilia sp.]
MEGRPGGEGRLELHWIMPLSIIFVKGLSQERGIHTT